MRKMHLIAAVVPTICCATVLAQGQRAQHNTAPPPRLRMMGMVSEADGDRKYGFASLESTVLGTQGLPLRARLPLATPEGVPERIEVQGQAVKLEVLQWYPEMHKNYVLLGPKLNTANISNPVFPPDKKGSGWLEQFDAPNPSSKLDGAMTFHLQEGWALVWSNPSLAVVRTDWVVGATEGSTLLVEIVNDTTHRLYFHDFAIVNNTAQVTIECLLSGGGNNPGRPTAVMQSIDVVRAGDTCNFQSWVDYSGNIPDFVEEALRMQAATQ